MSKTKINATAATAKSDIIRNENQYLDLRETALWSH